MRRRQFFFSSVVVTLILISAAVPIRPQGTIALLAEAGKKLTAGRNVNMVAGTVLPNGDPWLQRQNEPSLAASALNALHLVGGSNDYRTVDMPLDNEQLPGFQGPLSAAPDAWLGLYKSVDGGQSWTSTLLPGFPQDTTAVGKASPLRFNPALRTGFTAAADPVVRSGPAGMFYYSGIAFNRTQITGWTNSALFVARFLDKNNIEPGGAAASDPVLYIDTKVLDTDKGKTSTFIDKPWLAVDAPLAGAKTITIGGQAVPRHNVYMVYSLFTQTATSQSSTMNFMLSQDCGTTWKNPVILDQGGLLNQGGTIAIDPRANGNVYVAWRRFDAKTKTNAIMVARSRTKGLDFQASRVVALFAAPQGPFDQPSMAADSLGAGGGFRTNSYPSMAVDDKGIVYLVWAQRGKGPNNDARIMLATSTDGLTWTIRGPIDNSTAKLGHQFMPSIAFAAGKLTVAWYDQRDDYCSNNLGFGDWIIDNLGFRHTIDVRAAQADTSGYPSLQWQTVQVSRYHFTVEPDPDHKGAFKAFQAQWNPPNYPLFATAKQPFHGDYLDVAASVPFVRGSDGQWRFNTAATDNPLFHVAWTDNRDVRPPSNGNWKDYAAPWSDENSAFASAGRPSCVGGQQPGMRNQNVYTAQLFAGLAAGSPANAKALDLDVPRAFAVFVKNNTTAMRSFRLTIDAQPVGGRASFLQFERLDYLDVTIAPYSAISRQVFVNSTNVKASVLVRIDEIDHPDGTILSGGMKGSVVLNGDPTTIGVSGTEETHQPEIEAPHIRNWSANTLAVNPAVDSEDIVNTDIVNPNIVDLSTNNPTVVNPNLVDPALINPHIRNTDYLNPSIYNPHIRNINIPNTDPEDVSVTDVEWPVKNVGNTASSFSFTLIAKQALPQGLYAQLIVYKVHYTPAVAGDVLQANMTINGCQLKQEPHHEILLNIVNPDIVNPHIRNPNLLNPHIRNASIENATFVLGPSEEAIVNLRIIESHEEKEKGMRMMTTLDGIELPVDVGNFVESVGAAVTAQSVDSTDAAEGIEQPKTDATLLVITTTSLPPGNVGKTYPPSPYLDAEARLTAAGGTPPQTWWLNPTELPPGLNFDPATGQFSGLPLRVPGKTYPCVYSFTVQVTDAGSPQQSANQRFSIVIQDPDVTAPLTITTPSPLPVGTEGKPYGLALAAVGGVYPYAWRQTGGNLPPGLFMDDLGTIGGTPTLAGPYTFTVRVSDSDTAHPHAVDKSFALTIKAAEAVTYSISGVVTLAMGGARLPDVLMRGLPSAPSTDASGSYSDTVPAGWSGTAVPFKAGYYFVPSEISYANVQASRINQNYVAYPVLLDHFDISGVGNAVAGAPFRVTITAKDSRGETVTTYTDANVLSDTTGTITPKFTEPFANGVWTGWVSILKASTGVTIQTTGGGRSSQSNAFNVSAGAASGITIEDQPDGTGTEVTNKTLGPGHTLTVYAVSRDVGRNYKGTVSATWSLTRLASETIVPGDLVPSGDGTSAILTATPGHVGTCRIDATASGLGSDSTGTITIMATQVDDTYEDNDTKDTAKLIQLNTTYPELVLMDPDWYRITVPAAPGQVLRIHLKGLSYPDPDARHDLDMLILDGSGRTVGYAISGGDDETAFIPDAAGDYFIGLEYVSVEGIIYSLAADLGTSTSFGIGFVEGTVTSSTGGPASNVLVELYGEPFNWDVSRPATSTDVNGYYRIGFTPGKYTVRFNLLNSDVSQAPLVADANYIGKTYNDNQILQIVTDASIPNVNAVLDPGGTITGRVTDAQGNGLSMAVVGVYAGDATRPAVVYTDPTGTYVADRLPTGNYKVRARQTSVLKSEWYNEGASLASAQPVRVIAGQTTPGVDIDLEQDAAHIRGRVTDIQGNPIAGVNVLAYDEAGIAISSAVSGATGDYDISRLTTGQFRVYFNATTATGNSYSKYFPNEDLLSAASGVPVTAGQTTSNIDAQLDAGGTITGQVTDAASPGTGLMAISVLVLDTNSERLYMTTTDATGHYTVSHIRPDDYKVLFRPETGLAAAQWYANKSSAIGATNVTVVAAGTVSDINAQLASTSGSISGIVTAPSSPTPIGNVRVVAFDAGRSSPSAYISATATASDGTYRLKRLAGTDHKVYFDFDTPFFPYGSEYYAGKSTFALADLVPVVSGQNTANIGSIPLTRTAVDITTTSLTGGNQGQSYSASLAASGGRPFYYWTLESGQLPPGLTLTPNGEIRGIPTAQGLFSFTVRVVDSTRVGLVQSQTDTQVLTITVGAYGGSGFLISGKVAQGATGIPGVVMIGLPGSPVTNAAGQYVATVPALWSGTATPTLAGYAFNPPSIAYADVNQAFQNQDFTATAGFTISGVVTINGTPLPGVLMSGLPGQPRTDVNGAYSVSVLSGWNGTVTPTAPGFTFDPPNRSYPSVTANQIQTYLATFAGGVDDTYEENDSIDTARDMTLGTHADLVANDEDWYKVTVGAGQDLRIQSRGLVVPNPTQYADLDLAVFDSTHKLLATTASSSTDETIYLPGLAAGNYYIGVILTGQLGTVYSLTIETRAPGVNGFGIGYVTGKIKDAGGNGIANAFVELQQEVFNWGASWPIVTTDAGGNFKIAYAPGRYRIVYNSLNIPGYDYPWAPNANYVGQNSADLVTLTAGTTLSGKDVSLEQAGAITGRVTDPSGNPIGLTGALVWAFDAANRQVAYGWTMADGHYRITHLPTGNYKVRFRSNIGTFSHEWYDNAGVPENGVPVPVQAGGITSGIDAQLENWTDVRGFIQGHITDSSGNPLNNIGVVAYDSAGVSMAQGGTGGNGLGNYIVGPLRPGPYKIYFTSAANLANYVAEYYPDKALVGDAVPVLVQAGLTTGGIDAQLAAAGKINGRVTDANGNGLYGVTVMAMDIANDMTYSATTDAAGNYTILRVPPDIYRVRFRGESGTWATEWFDGKASFQEGGVVTVTAGNAGDPVNAQLEADGGSITGRVIGLGGAPAWGVRVAAYDNLKPVQVAQSFTDITGAYAIPRLPTAQVRIVVDADTNSLGCLTEYYNDRTTLETADPVNATRGGTASLPNITLGPIPALAIATATLPGGRENELYAASLAATGGRPFYYWSVTSGALPPGLTLYGDGRILGIPQATGTYSIVVRVIDSTRPQQSVTRNLSVTIGAYVGGFLVAGHISAGGLPLPGVVLNGLPGNNVTNAAGNYSVSVTAGWSGTVTPTLSGRAFTPANRVYNNVTGDQTGQDYIAAAGWIISGNINLNGMPLPGVLMSGLPGGPRTDASGVYRASVPFGWSGTVTPSLPGYTFTPQNRPYPAVSSDQTAQGYQAAFAGGADDAYVNNNTYETAAVITPGLHTDLVLENADWYKLYVSAADVGKILRVHVQGQSYPLPRSSTNRYDLDFYVIGPDGKLADLNASGGDDEYAFILDLKEGWYAIGLDYLPMDGVVYSLSADVGADFGLGVIEGRVTDDQGNGLEGIVLELYGQPFNWDTTRPLQLTGPNGYYKIGFLPGEYIVRYNVDDYLDRQPYITDRNYIGKLSPDRYILTRGSRSTAPDVRLLPGGTITGHLANESGGPMSGGRVRAYGNNGVPFGTGLASDASGNYFIRRIPQGNYKLQFTPANSSPSAYAWSGSGTSLTDALPVAVLAGQTTSGQDFQAGQTPGTIEGYVTDGSGAPLQGIQVNVLDGSGPNISLGSAVTDAAGHYSVGRLAAGPVKVRFVASDVNLNYASVFYPNQLLFPDAGIVMVQAGQTVSGIGASLVSAGTIRGRVTDASGNGLLAVSVYCADTGSPRFYTGGTDSNGNYSILDIAPGTYKIQFNAGYGDYATEWLDGKDTFTDAATITINPGQVLENINGQLESNGGTIAGHATGGGGSAIGDVVVSATDAAKNLSLASAPTDSAGNFTIRRLPTGLLKVGFNADANSLPYASESYNDKPSYPTADPVATTRGQATSNINAVLAAIPALGISQTSLPDGQLGVPYAVALQATGGRPFYRFTLDSGALPHGLTFNANGEIQGTPTTEGTFPITVGVTDSTRPQQAAARAYTLVIGTYTGSGHLISGRIATAGAVPVPGVVLAGLPNSPVTNAFGEYAVTVTSVWSGTVVPTLAGQSFVPASRTYDSVTANLQGQDYTAGAGFTISGTIMMNSTFVPGVLMSGLPGEVRTNTSGFYTASVPSGWTGTITPALPGYAFTPPSRDYNNVTGAFSGQDFSATYTYGTDDRFEPNDTYETAAAITPGVYNDLVSSGNEDWYKVHVSAADIGKIMRVHIKGVSYPNYNPTRRYNLDFKVVSESGRLLNRTVSGSDDEYAFVPDLAEGWYFIGLSQQYTEVYALSVDISPDYGLGYVQGRVMDQAGNGLEGIYVELEGDPYDSYVSRPFVTTGPGGSYKIGWIPGNYSVQFNAYDWDHQERFALDLNYIYEPYNAGRSMPVTAGSITSGIDIRLTAGGTLTGLVTGLTQGEGADVEVDVYDNLGLAEYYAYPDAQGLYTVDRIQTGNYKVVVVLYPGDPEAAGNVPFAWYQGARNLDEASAVHVQAGQTTSNIDVSLGAEPGGYIEGTVRDGTGTPVPSVRVQANDDAVLETTVNRIFPIYLAAVSTDANGHYRLGPLAAGSVKISFTSPGTRNLVTEYYPDKLLFQEALPVMVTAGQTTSGIDAQLAEGGTINGRVTDSSGNPLKGIYVNAIAVGSDRFNSATTDATGNYTIPRLKPDDYKIIFYPLRENLAAEWFDNKGAYPQAAAVTVSAGQQVRSIDARLESDGATITGRVTDSLGVPVKNAMVCARDAVRGLRYFNYVYTDANGNYILPGLPTSNIKLQFVTEWGYGFLPDAMEYYNNRASYELADPIATVRGQTISGINEQLDPYPELTISSTSAPAGAVASPYEFQLQASGGKPFLSWSLESGALPEGLSLKGNGVISGTPIANGTFAFTVRVVDSTLVPQSDSQGLTITVSAYVGTSYVLSGRVARAGVAVAGVAMLGLPGSPVTGASGEYVALVPAAWSGTVTPTLRGYVFDPPVRNYPDVEANVSGQDYGATTGYAVMGTVSSGGLGLAGVLLTGFPGTVTTDAAGHYTAAVPPDWSGTVVPALPEHVFTPTSRTYTRVLSTTPGQDYSGRMPGSIVYSSNSAGSFDIWVMDDNGSNKQNLSRVSHDPSGLYTEYSGRWSPDGMRIAFTSDKAGCQGVWIMDADGRNDHKLTTSNYQELECAWSPDGTKVYFSRNTSTTDNSGCAGCSNLDIYAYDVQSQTETRLTNNSYREECTTVSPDGTRIAWAKDESSGGCCGVTDIWIMNSDGSGQALLCGQPGNYDFGPIWGKAANKIYFSRHNWSTDYDIFSINPDGTGLTRLTDNSYYDAVLAASPDGSKILFKSNRNGQPDIWVMDSSGNILGQLTNDIAEEYYGDWTSSRVVPLFTETFESSTVGTVPSGWTVANGGVSIAVSNTRAQQGSQSLFIKGQPYGGANLDHYVSGLGISTGVYKLSFQISADKTQWTGTDGYAVGHLQIQGYSYGMGIKKDAGVYEVCMYGVSEKTVVFPGDINGWNKYDLIIDLDTHTVTFYFNGVLLGTNVAYNFAAPDRIQLAAGASGPGNGYPTVYYDYVTIERIR